MFKGKAYKYKQTRKNYNKFWRLNISLWRKFKTAFEYHGLFCITFYIFSNIFLKIILWFDVYPNSCTHHAIYKIYCSLSIEYISVQNTTIISLSIEGWACRWRPFRAIFCSESYWEYHDPLCTLPSKFHPTLTGHDLKPAKYCRGIQNEHHWSAMAPNVLMFDRGPLASAHHCDWSALDEHV